MLLRSEGKTVGRLDGRYTGSDYDDAAERYEYDPADASFMGPFVMAINDYIRRDLNSMKRIHTLLVVNQTLEL